MISADAIQRKHLLVRNDVWHQFRMSRHLSGRNSSCMLREKLVVFRRPNIAQHHVSPTRVNSGGKASLIWQ